VESPVDAAHVLSLGSAMLFPASLIPEAEIIIGVRQHMRISIFPELEGDAVRFEDFFCRPVAEVSSPLVRCSRAPEHSAMLRPANSWNRLLTMSVKLQKPNFDALLQVEKGGIAVQFTVLRDNEHLSRLKNVAVFYFFDAHWFPLKGNREVIRDFLSGKRKF
jgi:hypothetical protein